MLLVSNYHYIREDFSAPHPSIFGLTPKQFRMQLEELSKHGSFISRDELLNLGEEPFKKRYVLITFDDGLKEQYELAKPILDKMGIPFIFFINSYNFEERKVSLVHKIHLLRSTIASKELLEELTKVSSKNLTTEESQMAQKHYNYDTRATAELKYLLNLKIPAAEQQSFIDPLFQKEFEEEKIVQELYFDDHMLQNLNKQQVLGSHSHQHLALGQLKQEEVRRELEKSQAFFKRRFGKPSEVISYPFGSYAASSGISEEVAKAGFKMGFTMERAANLSLQHPYWLSRFDCNDLPGGKNNLFNKGGFFDPPVRKWHQNEAGLTYKQ